MALDDTAERIDFAIDTYLSSGEEGLADLTGPRFVPAHLFWAAIRRLADGHNYDTDPWEGEDA